MGLEIQRGRSKKFYGRFEIGGKPHCVPLGIVVEGRPPASLREEGDPAFERSRARAQAKLDRLVLEMRERASREELAQRVLEARTGSRLGSIPLEEMEARWLDLPRPRKLSERYIAASTAAIRRFVSFLKSAYPAVAEMSGVTDDMALRFLRSEEARRIAPKTRNQVLVLLRSCFSHLRKAAGIAENPFAGIPALEVDTIHRLPFTGEQLAAIIAAAEADPYIYRLIVVGATTALRLGDCARLRWRDVDLANGFVNVKTSKTRKTVTIPIFPLLRRLLERTPKTSDVVFPDLSTQYSVNPKLLTNRVRKVFERIASSGAADSLGPFHDHREGGLRRNSVRDFHCFRVTWVTLALNAGVPIDLVRKVTGHQTVEVVLSSYHRPGQEDFRRELNSKLPLAVTGGDAHERMSTSAVREKLTSMTDQNWKEIRDEILAGLRD